MSNDFTWKEIKEEFYDIISNIMNIDDPDRITSFFDKMNKYLAENKNQAYYEESVRSMLLSIVRYSVYMQKKVTMQKIALTQKRGQFFQYLKSSHLTNK